MINFPYSKNLKYTETLKLSESETKKLSTYISAEGDSTEIGEDFIRILADITKSHLKKYKIFKFRRLLTSTIRQLNNTTAKFLVTCYSWNTKPDQPNDQIWIQKTNVCSSNKYFYETPDEKITYKRIY